MSVTVVQKAWSINPNVRNTFTTLADMTGWFLFENKKQLISAVSQLGGTKVPWSVIWTCDGTTGPTNSADHTDRWTTKANAATRGATQGTAHSYAVLSNADGLQLLLEFVGATDDIARVAYSPGGLYVLAGTTTQSPTATDEVPLSVGNTIVNATASADRVMSIWSSDDAKGWRVALFRASAIVNIMGVVTINSMVSTRTSNPVFSVPYSGFRFTSVVRAGAVGTPIGGISGTAIGSAGNTGVMARVFTDAARNIRVGGGEIAGPGGAGNQSQINALSSAVKPALQNAEGSPLLPPFWQGEPSANLDGFLGYPADFWVCYTNSLTVPALADQFPAYQLGDNTAGATRSNWLIALGSACVWPWNNSAVSLSIA